LLRDVNISPRDHRVPLDSSSRFLERRARTELNAINEITLRSVRQINLFPSYKLRGLLESTSRRKHRTSPGSAS